jgi:hypothetical protein
VREAAEVGGVGELRAAGLDPLVAARADGEGVALGDGRTGASSSVRIATPSTTSWRQHLGRRPAFAPLVHSSVPKREPARREAAEPRGVKARSRSRSMTAPVPLKAGSSRSTPQRASPSAASQVAWNVRPTVWPSTCASERISATKASRPRRIWPMAPRRSSTRWPVSAQFTRQTSTSALSQRPSRMSVSVIRSEVSTPSASCASTDRSEPARTSEAVKPALRLEVGAVEGERPVVVGEAEGHAVGAGDPPAPGERRRAGVEMRLQGGGELLHRRISRAGWR